MQTALPVRAVHCSQHQTRMQMRMLIMQMGCAFLCRKEMSGIGLMDTINTFILYLPF